MIHKRILAFPLGFLDQDQRPASKNVIRAARLAGNLQVI